MQLGVDIVNLSFGGMDYYDHAFVEKVRQVTAAGITLVTASGNDGPRHGTVFNPADQMEVLAVGAAGWLGASTTSYDGALTVDGAENPTQWATSEFSSRGMTTWEFYGIGRPRPDLLAVGENLLGPSAKSAALSYVCCQGPVWQLLCEWRMRTDHIGDQGQTGRGSKFLATSSGIFNK